MLMYQKQTFDSYYCIKSFCCLKTLGQMRQKVPFNLHVVPIMAGKSMDRNCSSKAKYDTNVCSTVFMQ